MNERYDLKKLMEEIEQDEKLDKNQINVRISQDDIQQMIMERMKRKKAVKNDKS